MLHLMNRRDFFKTSAAGLIAGAALLETSGVGRAEFFRSISFYFDGDGWNAFNRSSIIRQAMYVVDRRLLDNAVLLNAYGIAGDGYSLTHDLWNITNLNSYYQGLGYRDILQCQLANLKISGRMPELHIRSAFQNTAAVGWANTNCVRVRFSPNGFTVEGEFDISLNHRFLGATGVYSDPYYWASVIAHEMLHNLGHLHENGYVDTTQMIAFERAFYWNGRYRRGLQTPVLCCGEAAS